MGVNVYSDERGLIKTVMMISISFWLRLPQKKKEIAMNPKRNIRSKKNDVVFYNMQVIVLCTAPKFW